MLEKDSKKLLLIQYKKKQEIESKIFESKKRKERRNIDKKYQEYLYNNWDRYLYYLSFSTDTFLCGCVYVKTDSIIHNSLVLNARRIWNNYRSKQKYYLKYINKLFEISNNNLYFGTLTLSDEYINNTSRETIYKLLESKIDYFIINEDYGKNTNRRHYHFVGLLKTSRKLSSNLIDNFYLYGFNWLKKVNSRSNISPKCLNLYITKLNCHSLKNKTKSVYVSKKLKGEFKK